jgi:hypothetical protein
MHPYLPSNFQRQSSKDGVTDEDLTTAIHKAEKGLIDADLGGRLISSNEFQEAGRALREASGRFSSTSGERSQLAFTSSRRAARPTSAAASWTLISSLPARWTS